VIFHEVLAATLAGCLVLGEGVTLMQVGGGLVILAGIFVARPKEKRDAAQGTA